MKFKYYIFLIVIIQISGCSSLKVPKKIDENINGNAVVNELGMNFIYIKPGTFIMGIPEGYRGSIEGKNPRHQVTITKGFFLQTTEVTQENWFKVTGKQPSFYKNCGKECPVEQVSWDDVQEFIFLLNLSDNNFVYRLPTEAEWEYAARSGSDGPYFWGECLSTFHANFNQRYSEHETSCQCPSGKSWGRTIPVASLEKNAWGLYDMYGNVAEWCQDYFGERPKLHIPITDPEGPEKGYARVVRGGSWSSGPTNCLSGYSMGGRQESRNYYTGFRLVMMPKKR